MDINLYILPKTRQQMAELCESLGVRSSSALVKLLVAEAHASRAGKAGRGADVPQYQTTSSATAPQAAAAPTLMPQPPAVTPGAELLDWI